VTLTPELGSLRVIGTDTDRSATYDFLLTFHSNHGPISYRFRDKRRFPSKTANQIFPTPCILRHTEGVPLGIGYRRSGSKKWGYRVEKKFDDIFSLLDTIHQRDGRTDTGRQQRLRLRIASHGKKHILISIA